MFLRGNRKLTYSTHFQFEFKFNDILRVLIEIREIFQNGTGGLL